MNGSVKGWLLSLTALAAGALGLYLVFIYRQELIDQVRLFSYKPSQEIVALADAAAMEGRGRSLFYISDPQVEDRDTFNANCTDAGEESLVLGCYKLQSIYIYNVTDNQLHGVKEVTAAHEMLHAAYERLTSSERGKLDELLARQLSKMSDERLNELVKLYTKEEPGHLLNEMHSILGTEFSNLSTELEEYYKQYFSDRQKVVELASGYAKVFTESQERIESYDSRLQQLRSSIDTNSTRLDGMKRDLEQLANQLDGLKSSDPTAYNSAVPTYNADVRAYNNLASTTRSLVEEHNKLVTLRNQEVASQNELYHSLDSNYQTVSTD